MRSVVRLRTRPGRPIWQLTTRPSTAAVLAVVSLVAAGVQVLLFSSPPPWYQIAVVAFWAAVGLAFLASAVGTRARARRRAATVRPAADFALAADPAPAAPVPARPAAPRRPEEPRAVAEVGEPTDPVVAPTTTLRPPPSPRRRTGPGAEAATATATVSRERIASAPRPAPTWRPSPAAEERTTTVAVTSRYAVRAVALVDAVSAETAVLGGSGAAGRSGTPRRAMTAETVAIRDGRVRPRPTADPRPRPTAGGRSEGADQAVPAVRRGGRRRLADESRAGEPGRRGGAAPTGAVPSPRPAPSEERPRPASLRATSGARPSPVPRSGSDDDGATVRRSVHSRRTAAQEREPREGYTRQDRGSSRRPDVTLAEQAQEQGRPAASGPTRRPRPTRRREGPPGSTETTAPFGGGLTFGGRAAAADPAPEAWAPAPRDPEPLSGRHAAVAAPPAESAPRGAARHAVGAEPGRRRAG